MLCYKCCELCRITRIGTLGEMCSPIDVVVNRITFNDVKLLVRIGYAYEVVNIYTRSWIRCVV